MIVFLGDLHLGRGSRRESLSAERDAVALIEAHRSAMHRAGGRLILLGDVFNAFLEYDSLIPAGFVRLQGALASLVDEGLEVTYLVGNRDPWHLTHFEEHVGVRIRHEALTFEAFGRRVYVAHGDAQAPSTAIQNRLRPVLRHPATYWLYRNVLPGDSGFRLARWVGERGSGWPEQRTIDALRDHARGRLASAEADVVVMGHSHRAELSTLPGGAYVNCGYWFAERTYAVLDDDGPRILRWRIEP